MDGTKLKAQVDDAKKKLATTGGSTEKKEISGAKTPADPNASQSTSTQTEKVEPSLNDEDQVLIAQLDRRASLTVVPKIGNTGVKLFGDKVLYALGSKKISLPDDKKRFFYNFLQKQLGGIGGLLFPYTPKISFNYSVNYETTNISQSNVQYNSYMNSPPPTIEVTGHFTADKIEHAKHMLSAIWFLQAITKCDVGNGERYYSNENEVAKISGGGLPPPVLYLNAYHQMIENIPVVIKSFGLNYPDDIDYVNIILDMEDQELLKGNQTYQSYKQTYDIYSDKTDLTTDLKTAKNKAEAYLADRLKMSFWLPMKMDITMSLLVQPNLSREGHVFNLDAYKAGVLKNPKVSATLTTNGRISGTFSGSPQKYEDINTRWSRGKKKYLPTGWSW